jgi:hypothetical protein
MRLCALIEAVRGPDTAPAPIPAPTPPVELPPVAPALAPTPPRRAEEPADAPERLWEHVFGFQTPGPPSPCVEFVRKHGRRIRIGDASALVQRILRGVR